MSTFKININKLLYRNGLFKVRKAPNNIIPTFNYVYKLLNLTYVTNIEYSIYGLDYDSV